MFRVLVLSLFLPTAAAQIVTDRPDLTESAEAVGGVQIETGLQITVPDGNVEVSSAEVAGPQALVRVGLVPGIEARIGLPDYVVVDGGGGRDGAFADPSVGAKVELGAVGPWTLAAIAEVSLPLGDDALSGPASPLAILVAGRDAGAVSIGTQAEVGWDRATDRIEVGGTFVAGTGLTDAVGAFLEAAAGSTPEGTAVLAQTGATLLLSPDLQLDAFLGAGLSDAAPDAFGGIGLSVRFGTGR